MEPVSQVLDRAEGMRRVRGDEKLFREIAELFLSDAPRLLQMIHAAIAQQSPKALRQAAHSLKGSASQIGACAVANRAWGLEKMGLAGTLVDVETQVDLLQEDLRQLAQVLNDGTKSDVAKSKE